MSGKELSPSNSNPNGEGDGTFEAPHSKAPRHRGVKVFGALAIAGVVAGAATNFLDQDFGLHGSVSAEKGSSTHSEFVKWQNMSKILAAEGTFVNTSQAGINVHMQYDLPGSSIPGFGSVSKFVGDKLAPDYKEAMDVTCAGKMQEIIPVSAISQKKVDNKLVETIDMSKVEMNPYCVTTTAEDDPGASKQLYAGQIIARDGFTKVGKTLHVLGDNTLPKPDVLMNKITDNSKNTMAAASINAMMKTCGPKLNTIVKKSAVEGVEKTILGLTDMKEGDFKVVPSYENGQVKWKTPKEDKTIKSIKEKHVSLGPSLKKFKYDKASCDTSHMQIIGGDAKEAK